MSQNKIDYRMVVGTCESAKQFGVDKGMPVTLLIDPNGRIADVHPGMVDKAAFERNSSSAQGNRKEHSELDKGVTLDIPARHQTGGQQPEPEWRTDLRSRVSVEKAAVS